MNTRECSTAFLLSGQQDTAGWSARVIIAIDTPTHPRKHRHVEGIGMIKVEQIGMGKLEFFFIVIFVEAVLMIESMIGN